MRTAFNFYRSYYETSMLLEGEDKLQFLEAIINYQFTGELIEPKNKLALLAFRGQIHSIKKQVIGYQKGIQTYPTGNPTKGKHKGKYKGSHKEVQVQVQEKVEVQEVKDKDSIDFDKLLDFINSTLNKSFRKINEEVRKKYRARLKDGYTKEQIMNAIKNASKSKFHIESKYEHLTPEFFSRADKIDRYAFVESTHKDFDAIKEAIDPTVWSVGMQIPAEKERLTAKYNLTVQEFDTLYAR